MSNTIHERPGLGKLSLDQDDVVADLRAGFASRRALLEWCIRLAVRTAGQVDADRPVQYLTERPTFAALLTPAARERHGLADVVADDTAAGVRRFVAAQDVSPARKAAVRLVRWNMVERTETDDQTAWTDPAGQQHVGMRPALTMLERRQQAAVGRFLDGLAGADVTLDEWVGRLNLATYGEHADAIEAMLHDTGPLAAVLAGDLAAVGDHAELRAAARTAGIIPRPDPDAPGGAVDALATQHGLAAFARFIREMVVAVYALPGCVRAASLVARRAQEAVETSETIETEPANL